MLCEVIGEPIKRLALLIGEPIKLTGKRALRKALSSGIPLADAAFPGAVTHKAPETDSRTTPSDAMPWGPELNRGMWATVLQGPVWAQEMPGAWGLISAVRSARLPVNLIGSPINYANRLIGSPITSQSTASGSPMAPEAAQSPRAAAHLDVLVIHVHSLLSQVVPQLRVNGDDQEVGDFGFLHRLQAAVRTHASEPACLVLGRHRSRLSL